MSHDSIHNSHHREDHKSYIFCIQIEAFKRHYESYGLQRTPCMLMNLQTYWSNTYVNKTNLKYES
jgi:hypothetical protein